MEGLALELDTLRRSAHRWHRSISWKSATEDRSNFFRYNSKQHCSSHKLLLPDGWCHGQCVLVVSFVSFSNCSQNFKKICTSELLGANVLNGKPIWFILTNGNHPMFKVSHSVLLGRKLDQNQLTLLSISQSLASRQITKNNQVSLLPTSAVSNFFMVSVCPRLLTQLLKPRRWKFKLVSWISTAENLFDRCGENKKYFRHIFRLMKKIEF